MKLINEVKTGNDRGNPGLDYWNTDDPYIIAVNNIPHCRACMAEKFNVLLPIMLRHGFPSTEHPMQRIPAM